VKNEKGLGMKVAKRSLYIVILALICILPFVPGCSSVNSDSNNIKISGAWDLISPFEREIIPAYNNETTGKIQVEFSPSAIEGLRQGHCDIALLGAEPSPAELNGLHDYVIAYDAVCVIIDANSYEGGEYWQDGTPVRKSAGFRNLSMTDLKSILTNYITPFGQRWFWEGSYYSWKPVFDNATGTYSANSTWVPDAKVIYPSLNFIPGKYDTQTFLYQKLGLDESEIAKAWNNQFADPKLNSEEEILSVEYPNGPPYVVGSGDFAYKIGFVSRRVIPVAMEHVPIKVISIDGIDPMQDTQAIYNGTYPLSRKIYLVTRENCSQAATQFVNFMLSAEGQQALTQAGYLPVD
jgi:hypothetical protein